MSERLVTVACTWFAVAEAEEVCGSSVVVVSVRRLEKVVDVVVSVGRIEEMVNVGLVGGPGGAVDVVPAGKLEEVVDAVVTTEEGVVSVDEDRPWPIIVEIPIINSEIIAIGNSGLYSSKFAAKELNVGSQS